MPRNLMIIPRKLQPELIRGYLHSDETGESADNALIHFFNPYGAGDWFISEAMPLDSEGEPIPDRPQDAADWHMFGFANIGDDRSAELGYTLLSQLQEIKLTRYKFPLERELIWSPKPLADIQEKSRARAFG